HFLDELVRKQQASQDGKPRQGALYFVSFSIPEEGLKRMLGDNRLWGWGVIAQFAYYLAGFPWYEGNILFAFAVAAQVLTWCETRSGWRTAAAILLIALWGPLSGTSYGIAGLLMLAVSHRLYRAEDRTERLALVACLLAVILALNFATSDVAAVAGLVITVLTVGLVSCTGKSLPRFWPGDFFPTFYACHLAVLGVLAL
ncbi:type-F conjugative transfer system pilin acetylase TraX, partial [Escherichia coli]|uniref:type-F conjugative transfer system pilin acetylase TraX n=1 Tax=Escherichia coli TaxID=562 RepID=UPI00202357DA